MSRDRSIPAMCELCPEICAGPLEAVLPGIPSEEVCISALKYYQQNKGLGAVSSRIEQEIAAGTTESFPSIQDDLDAIVEEDSLVSFRAKIVDSYMQLFESRAQGKAPEQRELRQAKDKLFASLPEYRALLEMSNDQIRNDYSDILGRKGSPKGLRGFVTGLAGEATVLYLSLVDATNEEETEKGQALFPSSPREDDPFIVEIRELHRTDIHDAHTYNPDDPTSRTLVSIKARSVNRSPRGATTAEPIHLLSIATRAYHDLCKQNSSWETWKPEYLNDNKIPLNDVIALLMQTNQPESPFHELGVAFQTVMARRVQQKIMSDPGA